MWIVCTFNIKQPIGYCVRRYFKCRKPSVTAVRTGQEFSQMTTPFWLTSVWQSLIRVQADNRFTAKTETGTGGEWRNLATIVKFENNSRESMNFSHNQIVKSFWHFIGRKVRFLEDLNGIFALPCMILKTTGFWLAVTISVLFRFYQGWDKTGAYYVASELKALEGYCDKLKNFFRDNIITVRMENRRSGMSVTGWNMIT